MNTPAVLTAVICKTFMFHSNVRDRIIQVFVVLSRVFLARDFLLLCMQVGFSRAFWSVRRDVQNPCQYCRVYQW